MKAKYDIVIIGAGPAGLAAAIAASSSEEDIVIIDNNPQIGGQIWRAGPEVTLPKVAQEMYIKILNTPNITIISSAKVIAEYEIDKLLIETESTSLILCYKKLILCTGAREIFVPFPGWTLPGVTGAGGLQALIKSGISVKSEKIVIAGSGPLLLASAYTAKKSGAEILCILEQVTFKNILNFIFQLWRWPKKIYQSVLYFNRRYTTDSYVIEAIGKDKLEAVRLKTPYGVKEISCDRLACGFGLTPNTQVAQLLNCKINDHSIEVDNYQRTSRQNIFAAGECTGFGGSELALCEGEIAGLAAIGKLDMATLIFPKREHYQKFAKNLNNTFTLREELKSLSKEDTIFCRCEDVTFSKVGCRSGWVDAKLHTRCGMGACQGSTCATSARLLFNWDIPSNRPPILPAKVKSIVSIQSTSLNNT